MKIARKYDLGHLLSIFITYMVTGKSISVHACLQALALWMVEAHEGGKFVASTHRPPLPRRKYSW
jgi:hypothetical protein